MIANHKMFTKKMNIMEVRQEHLSYHRNSQEAFILSQHPNFRKTLGGPMLIGENINLVTLDSKNSKGLGDNNGDEDEGLELRI